MIVFIFLFFFGLQTFVQKKVKNSPEKDDLKKQVKYLEAKAKNFEKAFARKKTLEEECKKLF